MLVGSDARANNMNPRIHTLTIMMLDTYPTICYL